MFNRIIELRDTWTAKRDASSESIPRVPAVPATNKASGKAPSQSGDEPESRRTKTDVRDTIRAASPELAARLTRYHQELGLSFEDADLLSSDLALAHFFEDALRAYDNAKSVANWVTNEVLREAKESKIDQLPIRGRQLGAHILHQNKNNHNKKHSEYNNGHRTCGGCVDSNNVAHNEKSDKRV